MRKDRPAPRAFLRNAYSGFPGSVPILSRTRLALRRGVGARPPREGLIVSQRNRRLLRSLALWFAASSAQAQIVSVGASVETDPVPSSGDAADDVAIWVHPSHPGLSLLIGTDKQSGLAVYDLQGNQRQFLASGDFNNVDIRYRFPLAGNERALVATGERNRDLLALFAVDPQSRTLQDVAARDIVLGIEIYGCCLYRSPLTGDYYFFGTSGGGSIEQWRLFAAGGGRVDAVRVRAFDVGEQSEGCVADDETGYFYVAEENVGIWRYGAEPGAGTGRVLVDSTGPGGELDADVEGLAIYYAAGGGGYLIASSQGSSTFVVYERAAPNRHVVTFEIAADLARGIDGVSNTDGIDVANLWLGNSFSGGLFVAQDHTNPGSNQNFKLVSWRDIAAAASPPLLVDNTYDAHRARCDTAGWAYRNGSGANPFILTSLRRPVLGTTWECELDCAGHSPSSGFIAGFLAPGSGLFIRAGEVLVDIRSTHLFSQVAAHGGGAVRFSLPLPPDLLLCGLGISVQGACLGRPGAALSNAIDLTLGQ